MEGKGKEGPSPTLEFIAEPTPPLAHLVWFCGSQTQLTIVVIGTGCKNINSWAPSQRLKVGRSRSETWGSVSKKCPRKVSWRLFHRPVFGDLGLIL